MIETDLAMVVAGGGGRKTACGRPTGQPRPPPTHDIYVLLSSIYVIIDTRNSNSFDMFHACNFEDFSAHTITRVQEYLAHTKLPLSQDHRRALGMVQEGSLL